MRDYSNAKPRNDYVLIRVTYRDREGNLVLAQSAAESKIYTVFAVGPKVEGLTVGDEVWLVGQERLDWSYLPGSSNIIIIKEANVVVVIEKVPPEPVRNG